MKVLYFFAVVAFLVISIASRHLEGIVGEHGPSFHHPKNYEGGYTFWSSDQHIAPIADFKGVVSVYRSNDIVIDESLSGHCHLMQTCSSNLKVLNKETVGTLTRCPNKLKRQFWDKYQNDPRMNTVDAFVCHHNFALCELFMAFNRPLILVASSRYENGRWSADAWHRLNDNVRAISRRSENTIAANNRYDAEYLKHFTGLSDVKVLPNQCNYVDVVYQPSRREILIGPGRLSGGGEHVIRGSGGLLEAAAPTTHSFAVLRELYPKFEYGDLVQHPAIVLIPYQVSVMSIFEYYKMGIPLFAPSLELLVKWQIEHRILGELSWNCVRTRCDDPSAIEPHPNSPHPKHLDPNNVTDVESMKYWIQFADFYQLPHITVFNNWDDLFVKLGNANLDEIHKEMTEYSSQRSQKLKQDWQDIFGRAFSGKTSRRQFASRRSLWKQSWTAAMEEHYPETAVHIHSTC